MKNSSARTGLRLYLFIGLVLLALAYLFLRGVGAFLIIGDSLKQADAVVPLGGGSAERVTEAVDLIDQRYAAVMIITEPGEVKQGEGRGSEYYRQVAVEDGLSPHAILITDGIQSSTHDEAVAVLKLLEQQQLKSVIVVTEPYHTLRARLIFRDVFRGSGRTVRVRPVLEHWYRSETWFLSSEGWQLTLKEYAKLIGYELGIYKSLE